ncbi:MAG: tetratricopeptide repeat protein, partial [Armatimonadota bacterium]|nr:tetratricopeptide repeat protein [Armatimonadota bacterium]
MRMLRISIAFLLGMFCLMPSTVLSQQLEWPSQSIIKQKLASQKGPAQQAQAHFQKGMQYRQKGKFTEAIAEFKQVIKLAPNAPIGYIHLALTYLGKGDLRSAEAPLKTAVKLDNKNVNLRIQLAQIYLQTNRPAEAIATASEAAKKDPKNPGVQFILGAAYIQQKNNQAAITAFRKVTQMDPKNIGAYINMGLIYTEMKDYANARQVLAKAAAIKPDEERIIGMQAMIEERADKVHGAEKAIAIYKKALAKNPRNTQIQFIIGATYDRMGKPKEAITYYEGVIAKEPNMTLALMNAARVYLMDKDSKNAAAGHKKAAGYLKRVLKSNPNSAVALGMLGLAELYLNDLAAAEKHYVQAQKLDPGNIGSMEGLSFIYERNNKLTEAAGQLDMLRNVRKDDPQIYLRLARTYDRAGDTRRALGTYLQTVETFPKNTEAMAERAAYLDRQNEKEKAVEQYRAIMKLKPDDMKTQISLANVYANSEDAAIRDKAIPELETAKKMALKAKPPKDPKEGDDRVTPFMTLAAVYEKNGRAAKASDEYYEALKLSTNNTQIYQSLAKLYEKDIATIDKAIETYRKLTELEPDNRGFYRSLGDAVNKKTGKPDSDLEEFRQLIAAKPQALAPRYVLAESLNSRTDEANQQAAVKEFEEILKIKPDEEQAMVRLSQIFTTLKQPDKNLEILRKIIDANPAQGYALREMDRIVTEKNEAKATADWLDYLKSLTAKKESNSPDFYKTLTGSYVKANRGAEVVAILDGIS